MCVYARFCCKTFYFTQSALLFCDDNVDRRVAVGCCSTAFSLSDKLLSLSSALSSNEFQKAIIFSFSDLVAFLSSSEPERVIIFLSVK